MAANAVVTLREFAYQTRRRKLVSGTAGPVIRQYDAVGHDLGDCPRKG
ncbi:hypothetical protein [Nitrosomonas sp. ANs5]